MEIKSLTELIILRNYLKERIDLVTDTIGAFNKQVSKLSDLANDSKLKKVDKKKFIQMCNAYKSEISELQKNSEPLLKQFYKIDRNLRNNIKGLLNIDFPNTISPIKRIDQAQKMMNDLSRENPKMPLGQIYSIVAEKLGYSDGKSMIKSVHKKQKKGNKKEH